MRKWLIALPALVGISAAPALAACPAFTTFSNGSTADANQVNTNFSTIANCFAPLASPLFTGSPAVGTSAGGWTVNAAFSSATSASFGWAGSFYNSQLSPSGGGALLVRVDSTNAYLLGLYGGGVYVGSITTNGTGAYFNTASDRRLKTNIEPVGNGLNLLMRLQPELFNWKSAPNAPKTMGFVADELQTVFPDAVTGKKDAVNPDGSIRPQQVDYSKLVPLLVAAVKDQQAEIDALKAQISAAQPGK